MDEDALWAGSIAFELGLPVLLVVVAICSSRFRRSAVSVLGAVSPMLGAYLYVSAAYVLDPNEMGWAFGAVWIMTFFAYSAMVGFGLLLGVLSKPNNLAARFFVAALAAPCVVFALLTAESYLA